MRRTAVDAAQVPVTDIIHPRNGSTVHHFQCRATSLSGRLSRRAQRLWIATNRLAVSACLRLLAGSGSGPPSANLSLQCAGMPISQKHKGDLYVTYTVAFPPRLSEEQKRVVKEHFPPASMRQAHEEL